MYSKLLHLLAHNCFFGANLNVRKVAALGASYDSMVDPHEQALLIVVVRFLDNAQVRSVVCSLLAAMGSANSVIRG